MSREVHIAPYAPSRDEYPKAVAVWGDRAETHLVAILLAGLSPWAARDGVVNIDGCMFRIVEPGPAKVAA